MPATVPPDPRPGTAGHPRRIVTIAGALLLSVAAACTEEIETTAVCADAPELCPEQRFEVEQVVLNPVVLDTSLTGVPLLGNEPYLGLVRHGGTVDTRPVYRFDELPQKYRVGSGSDSAAITQVIEPVVQLVIDRRESDFDAPVTIEAFDVTHAGSDTSSAEILPLFTDARRLGTLAAVPRPSTDTITFDTLRVPLDPAVLLDRITTGERLRIGLRLAASDQGSLLLTHGATIRFDVSTDTAIAPVVVGTRSETPTDDPVLRSDLRSYLVVADGSPTPAGSVLSVGGFPNRRSFLRFEIPTDQVPADASVLRATLVLTQRPVSGFAPTDTFLVRALPLTASSVVTDLDQLVRLAANPRDPQGGEIPITAPMKLVPGDSGQREMAIANLVTLWSARSGVDIQPAIVLAVQFEGASPLRAEFFSSEAAAELRPQLRVSFVRRVNFDIP
ncbi:MAG TPA: hypothetical protein VGE02_14515 [Gemmatimonadales bacterium]